ncbi:MAG TPA: HTH domain-containing protein [Euzebyales bacterium]|nr:HTH domain-containing protein [Euzebyales bacterium]
MDRRIRLAASSRDGHLALRRVERQQALIERLHAAHGQRQRMDDLAHELGVSARTVARDVERLRLSGVPLDVRQGRGGGVRLARTGRTVTVTLDLPEVAALMSSLAVLGPTVSPSAAAAMRKLAASLRPAGTAAQPPLT